MDQLVQFLFKYKWSVFAKGHLGWANRPSWPLIVLAILLISALVYYLYGRQGQAPKRPGTGTRAGLVILRASLLALLFILLMRPVLVVPSVIPKSTSLAVLADNSRSMQLADEGGRTRIENEKTFLSDQKLTRALDARFKVNNYRFSSTVDRINSPQELTAEGTATDLAASLDDAVKDSSGLPLSAVVVVSDGGVNSPRDLEASLRSLRARGVPVFTVGVGSPDRFKDAELVRVTTPRRVLVGSSISAEALVRVNGYQDSTKVIVAVSEDGKALKTETVTINGNEAQTATIEFTPTSPGAHRYNFSVKPLEAETTIENNGQESLIEVTNEHPKVLYFDGEPRWEYGKIRSALARNEKNLTLVSVLRSAEGKYYRQGVTTGQELESGLPRTPEELFAYQGLILGSIEANYFSYDQLKQIELFVSRRGGGFLAIAGSRAFDAGKYANTPVADLLPLYLNDRIEEPEIPLFANFKAVLTPRGKTHAITRLNEDRAASARVWDSLPPITVPEILGQPKPGATVLIEAQSIHDKNRAVPMLAEEKYGRGRTLVLTANDTWRWRMELESKNTAHETFWRQMLRYLVSTAPNPIEVQAERDVYAPGDPVQLRADVDDSKFEPIREAQATARITKPSGETVDVPLQFNLDQQASDFRGEFKPDAQGLYRIELTARRGGASIGSAQSTFLVADLNREFHDAAQNVELLKRVAAETGGKYYPLQKANSLIDDLTYLEGNNSERVSKDLWDMPFNFMLLVGLVSGEWFLRKKRGMA
jgi:uncharacterized membrane protein